MKKSILAIALLLVASCVTMKYQDDSSFLVSAQANSPELPVTINGTFCKDSDGIVGMCAKRVASNKPLVIHMAALPYDYTLSLRCTSQLGESGDFPVLKDKAFDKSIDSAKYLMLPSGVNSFICNARVLPKDRPEPVGALWKIFANIVDERYTAREIPRLVADHGKNYLIFGQYAKHSAVKDQGEWKQYDEKTVVQIHGNPADVQAYSESYNMRFNSVGL